MTLRTPEQAEERARYAIEAAQVLLSHAGTISDHCNWAQDDEVVLAIVKRDLIFGATVAVPLAHLREEVMSRLEVGWTLVFSPGATEKDIETRCNKMVALAQARLDVIRRWRDEVSS